MSDHGWAGDECYELLGSAFRIRSQTPEVAAAVDRLLALFRVPARAVPGGRRYSLAAGDAAGGLAYTLGCDGAPVQHGASWASVLDLLLTRLNAEAIDAFGGFAVHAGAVAAGRRVLAFPADSGAGKTTLTAACLAAGLEYVSDEALCVDVDSGDVVAYPKPLTLSSWSRAAVGLGPSGFPWGPQDDEAAVEPATLGATVAGGQLRLTDVVRLVRSGEAPQLVELPRSDALGMLLQFSFNHYRRPGASFELAGRLARDCRAWRLTYGDPGSAGVFLAERFAVPVRVGALAGTPAAADG